ncbi:hypothetical protein OCD85_01065 [Bacillus pacificus]|nr:hypothetical protein [Bacillus pacificus]MCU5359636.1 hypothetical protein [Bacillus pacificus]MCU5400316.1 hypothetical protein [Bacillus pacificus]
MEEDKIGTCDICDKENVKVIYSPARDEWLCEWCYDYTASIMFGEIMDE